MAILRGSRGISLEAKFSGYKNEWVEYSFAIKFEGEPIRSDRISPPKEFFANDEGRDYLIIALEKALETGQFTVWPPLEPDAWIEIQRVGDDFRIAFFADTIYYSFPKEKADGSLGYTDNGVGISFLVARKDLEKFVADLKAEYEELKEKFSIPDQKI